MEPVRAQGPARDGAATIPTGLEAPSLARTFVSAWLGGSAHPSLHEDARLLVSELVTNSVRHAGQPAGAPVRVRAAAANGVVRVEVEDDGQRPVRRRTREGRTGGFGLELVEQLAARWGVSHANGTCVWFELSLRGGGAQVSMNGTCSIVPVSSNTR
jgi:anti-sigma regulatory factor (Ser/Thr protein kinase)